MDVSGGKKELRLRRVGCDAASGKLKIIMIWKGCSGCILLLFGEYEGYFFAVVLRFEVAVDLRFVALFFDAVLFLVAGVRFLVARLVGVYFCVWSCVALLKVKISLWGT